MHIKKNLQVSRKVKELAAEERSLLNSSSNFFLSFFLSFFHLQGSLTTRDDLTLLLSFSYSWFLLQEPTIG
jgi:hypothetical protein